MVLFDGVDLYQGNVENIVFKASEAADEAQPLSAALKDAYITLRDSFAATAPLRVLRVIAVAADIDDADVHDLVVWLLNFEVHP